MQVTLVPIRHTYFSKNKGKNIVNYEQILMRENEQTGYPFSIFHVDLFWKDGLKDIHDKLSRGDVVTAELDFREINEN